MVDSADAKKQRERAILDLIYASRQVDDVAPSERPDFVLRHRCGFHFGVEIAELYHSQTTARLERIPEYAGELLSGGRFRHKDDAGRIKVGRVDILSDRNEVVYSQVEAIIQDAPPVAECARTLAALIAAKTEKLASPPTILAHVNLLIHDRTNVLFMVPREKFFQLYFQPELKSALASTQFREVFFLTKMKDGTGFVPLKMLWLMSEVYFFNAIYTATESHARFTPARYELEVFASYFGDRVKGPVLFRVDAGGMEVIYGDAGFLVAADKSVFVRTYQDDPFPADARPPERGLADQLGPDFMGKLTEHHASNTFVSGICFPAGT
ncbi:MAG: hypothetical protein ABSB35_10985 [Bryobacteraceae bacterium]|jgi:hypothetical protein